MEENPQDHQTETHHDMLEVTKETICVDKRVLLSVSVLIGVFVLGMVVSNAINKAGTRKIATKSRAEAPQSDAQSTLGRLTNPSFDKYINDEHFVLFGESDEQVAEGRFLAVSHVDDEFAFKEPKYSCVYSSAFQAGVLANQRDEKNKTYYLSTERNIPKDGFNSRSDSNDVVNKYILLKSIYSFFRYSNPTESCSKGYMLFYQAINKGNLYIVNVANSAYSNEDTLGDEEIAKLLKNSSNNSGYTNTWLIKIPFQKFVWSKANTGTMTIVDEYRLEKMLGRNFENYVSSSDDAASL